MTKVYLEQTEIEALESAAKTPRDRLFIRILHRLGCRVSEALSLTAPNIDFENGMVIIVHLKSLVWMNCQQCGAKLGLRHDFCPKCGAKNELNASQRAERRRQRSLPLDSETLSRIRSHIDSGGVVIKGGQAYLFGINRHRAWQIVRQCAERAGLPNLVNPESGKPRGVSPHRLRDAFAVNAMKTDDSGDGLRLLQEHLGHVSFDTTAKYRKIAGKEHQEWYQRLWNRPQQT